MGGRPDRAQAWTSRFVFAFVLPAMIAGGVVLILTARDADPGSRERALGLAARLSAVPAVGDAPAAGASSTVERVVTGSTGPAPATEPGVEPVEPRPAAPARIIIPEVGVDASVVPVGATDDGIEVPPVFEAGWFAEGPRPSEPGRAIILGHLDSLDGPAAFTQVPQARPGTEVAVVDEAGLTHTFRILRTLEVEKSDFPADEVYGATRRPSLALITCGGEFDPETGYENNVIVFARQLRKD